MQQPNPSEGLNAYYEGLVGATITRFFWAYDAEEDFLWPNFEAVKPDGTKLTIEVSGDEEGNRPGFLFGLPKPSLTQGEK